MPNHCTHVVSFTGSDVALDDLQSFVKGDGEANHFAFERIIPVPACIFRGDLGADDERANPGRNWYAWNLRRWGTKWNAYGHVCPVRDSGRLTYRFQTAWSYPAPIFDELHCLFPDLRIEVEAVDEGWNWARRAKYLPFEYDRWDPKEIGSVEIVEVECSRGSTEFQELYSRVYECDLPEDEDEIEEDESEAPDA